MTITALLTISAVLIALAAGIGKAPLWPAVLLLGLVELLRIWPLG